MAIRLDKAKTNKLNSTFIISSMDMDILQFVLDIRIFDHNKRQHEYERSYTCVTRHKSV